MRAPMIVERTVFTGSKKSLRWLLLALRLEHEAAILVSWRRRDAREEHGCEHGLCPAPWCGHRLGVSSGDPAHHCVSRDAIDDVTAHGRQVSLVQVKSTSNRKVHGLLE